jgi:hypothetical protein
VLAPLTGLERLFLRSTDLQGPLTCDLIKGKPELKILDLSDTPVTGSLPPCIMGVSAPGLGTWPAAAAGPPNS